MPHHDSDDLGSGVFFDEDDAPTVADLRREFPDATEPVPLAELERREAAEWVEDFADALGEHQVVAAYLTNALACRAVGPFNAAVDAFHLTYLGVVEALGRTPLSLQD